MVFRPDALPSEAFKKYFVESPQSQMHIVELLHRAVFDRAAIDAETADQKFRTIETPDAVSMGSTKKKMWSGDPLKQWCDEMYERYVKEQAALRKLLRSRTLAALEIRIAEQQLNDPVLNQGAFAYTTARMLNGELYKAQHRNNEDVVGIHPNGYVVGDGISGAGSKNLAFVGTRAIDAVVGPIFGALTEQQASAKEIRQVLLRVPQWARIQLTKAIQKHPDPRVGQLRYEKQGMSSTLEMVFYAPWLQKAFIAHVGDSRTYLVQGAMAKKMTEDHKRSNLLNLLTHAISMRNERSKIDIHECDVEEGDVIESDTDGMFTEREMLAKEGRLPKNFAGFLRELADQGISDSEQAERLFGDAAEQQFRVGHFDDRATARLRIKTKTPG